jgi:hypothetical protein
MLDKLVHIIAECSGQMPGHDHSLPEAQQSPNMSANPLAAGKAGPRVQQSVPKGQHHHGSRVVPKSITPG